VLHCKNGSVEGQEPGCTGCDADHGTVKERHESGPPMDLANMRRQGMQQADGDEGQGIKSPAPLGGRDRKRTGGQLWVIAGRVCAGTYNLR
jgi:hypothetical protein